MKFSIFLLMLCALTGCARHQGDLPPVSGEPEPVNSPPSFRSSLTMSDIQNIVNVSRSFESILLEKEERSRKPHGGWPLPDWFWPQWRLRPLLFCCR